MKYEPPTDEETTEEQYQQYGFRPDRIPISEDTKFLRWGTQVERDDMTFKRDFMERHSDKIRSVNKFMALANYRDKGQKQIERLRRMEIGLMRSVGLDFDAEEITLDTIGDAQYSRGYKGFYTKELNTQRARYKDETEREPSKTSFFKTKEKQPKEPDSEVRW